MKKFISTVCYLLLFTSLLPAIEYELDLKAGFGKRFIDGFDRGWPNIRYNSDEIGVATSVKSLSFIRNIGYGDFTFLVSPFYKHFFGVSFSVFAPLESAFVKSTIAARTHESTFSGFIMSPALAYQFYPFKERSTAIKHFYFGTSLGAAMATFTLSHNQTSSTAGESYSESIAFSSTGIRGQLRAGIKYPAFYNFSWIIEAGFEIIRIEELEGSNSRTNTTLIVKKNGSELAPASATDSNFQSFSSVGLWFNQFLINFGLSYTIR